MSDTWQYKPPFGLDIRIKPPEGERPGAKEPVCEWSGCFRAGPFRAPKSPKHLGDYHHFCLEHVRSYNRGWDFFNGMSDAEVAAYQESGRTGHRPTWSLGANAHSRNGTGPQSFSFTPNLDRPEFSVNGRLGDPLGVFGAGGAARPEPASQRRRVGRLASQALVVLGLDETATLKDVKLRYKELVKRFHPDANGGDRSAEDSLRRVIKAYQILRTAGFR